MTTKKNFGKESIEKFVADFITQIEKIRTEGTKVEWNRGFTPLLQHFYNPFTKNPYNGGNVFTAWVYMSILGYNDARFLTLNNAKKLAKEFEIDLSKTLIIEKEKFLTEQVPMFHFQWVEKETEERDENGDKKKIRFPLINVFNVFCIESFIPEFQKKFNEKYPLPVVDTTIPAEWEEMTKWGTQNVGVELQYNKGVNSAYYDILDHKIVMPFPKQYFKEERAISTFFHELAHSTSKKLGRELTGRMGDTEYAKEEIIAELASTIILNILGYEVQEKTYAYIIGYLRGNKAMTIWGMLSKVMAAVNLMLGKQEQEQAEQEQEQEQIPA